jgi:hypothetical protein
MRCEATHALERWSSARGDLRAQNAAYRLAWGHKFVVESYRSAETAVIYIPLVVETFIY